MEHGGRQVGVPTLCGCGVPQVPHLLVPSHGVSRAGRHHVSLRHFAVRCRQARFGIGPVIWTRRFITCRAVASQFYPARSPYAPHLCLRHPPGPVPTRGRSANRAFRRHSSDLRRKCVSGQKDYVSTGQRCAKVQELTVSLNHRDFYAKNRREVFAIINSWS